jgi:hypothetical protein
MQGQSITSRASAEYCLYVSNGHCRRLFNLDRSCHVKPLYIEDNAEMDIVNATNAETDSVNATTAGISDFVFMMFSSKKKEERMVQPAGL